METTGNKFGESKSQEQERIHNEGLRRAHGDMPHVGSGCTPQREVIRDSRESTDAVLNWASGNHVASAGPGEPASPGWPTVAGVSGPGLERAKQPGPPSNVRPAPDCSQGNLNASGIFGKG